METIHRSNTLNPTISIDDGEIPDWLLFEILLRLPLNSVYQCRAVSKRWLCVASDPYFVRSYASRAASLSSPWIVLPQSVYKEENLLPAFVHNPSNNNVVPRKLRYPRPLPRNSWDDTPEGYSIIGASDGLVLYHYPPTRTLDDDTYLFDFCVCNPITGNQTEPVTLQVPFYACSGWGFLTRIDDRDLKSYRIVHATEKGGVISMYVYCSEVGEWDKFEVAGPENCPSGLQESAAVLDGILYWAGATGDVIAYDPKANPPEQVRFIRDPHDSERLFEGYYSCACVGYRGEVRYFGGYTRGRDEIPSFNIWKLEDDLLGEWSLLHKIENTEQIRRAMRNRNRRAYDRLDVLCFDPFDSDVVYLFDDYGPYVFSCDMKSGAIDDYHEMIVSPSDGFPWNHVLVLPPWPTHVAEKHLERHSRGVDFD